MRSPSARSRGSTRRSEPAPSHIVSVYGADHPGIVHAVSDILAGRGVSITDLETRLAGGAGDEPVYAMMLEVAVPADVDPSDIEQALAETAREPARGADVPAAGAGRALGRPALPAREVLRYPHPALKREAAAVADHGRGAPASPRTWWTRCARSAGCVGLAAPQIGEEVRIVVVDVTDHRRATVVHGLLAAGQPAS